MASNHLPTPPRTPSPSTTHIRPHQCKSRRLIVAGYRPKPTTQTPTFCPDQCIYCSIWSLALLLNNLLTQKTPLTPYLQRQRSRLESIMCMSTVQGATESEGLYVAYQRCLNDVMALLEQEERLQRQQSMAEIQRRRLAVAEERRWQQQCQQQEKHRQSFAMRDPHFRMIRS